MYKIALITAHIGNPDKPELTITPECQKEFEEYGVDVYRFNNSNLLEEYAESKLYINEIYKDNIYNKLRNFYNAKIRFRQKNLPNIDDNYNRLIAKIPKILFYKIVPQDYEYYIWCDSKFTLQQGFLCYILDLIKNHRDKDLISYSHSERSSIQLELDYMKFYMINHHSKSLNSKYNLAEMEKQVFFYKKDQRFVDVSLYELGIIIYSNKILNKKGFLEEWYAHNFYFTIQDQLSFPYLIALHKVKVGIITHSVFETGVAIHNHY